MNFDHLYIYIFFYGWGLSGLVWFAPRSRRCKWWAPWRASWTRCSWRGSCWEGAMPWGACLPPSPRTHPLPIGPRCDLLRWYLLHSFQLLSSGNKFVTRPTSPGLVAWHQELMTVLLRLYHIVVSGRLRLPDRLRVAYRLRVPSPVSVN